MGANNKYEAAMHGGEHDFGSADPVSANRVRFMSESEFDRFIAKVRAEAKAEALEEAAISVMDERIECETEASNWLDTRANQYKEES